MLKIHRFKQKNVLFLHFMPIMDFMHNLFYILKEKLLD